MQWLVGVILNDKLISTYRSFGAPVNQHRIVLLLEILTIKLLFVIIRKNGKIISIQLSNKNRKNKFFMSRLENKVALITGGAGGIGKATAKQFLNEGGRVMLIDLNEDDLRKLQEELASDAVYYIAADVSKTEDVKKYAKKAEDLFGKVDVFFNNAGIEGQVKPITDYPVEEFDKVMAVNVRGAWLGMKFIIPLMKDGGSIIISSSVAGLRGTANVSAYVASKHALNGITRSLALELAERNIRVNAINPSPVDNRMMRSLEQGFSPDDTKNAKSQFEQMIPLGRYAVNKDIANLVAFLASDESSFITGAIHAIDGGMTAK